MTGVFYVPLRNTGVERTPSESQHTKFTLEKKILPPLLPGFKLESECFHCFRQLLCFKRKVVNPFFVHSHKSVLKSAGSPSNRRNWSRQMLNRTSFWASVRSFRAHPADTFPIASSLVEMLRTFGYEVPKVVPMCLIVSRRFPQWGAADAEIKVQSGENTELKRSPFQALSLIHI